jgi:dolichol-phosphate mannosyltransferase
MSGNIVVEAMINVTKWGLTARWKKLTGKRALGDSWGIGSLE